MCRSKRSQSAPEQPSRLQAGEFPCLVLPERPWQEIPRSERTQRIKLGRKLVRVELPERVRTPLVVNYGMGTDSTAMLVLLVEMVKRGDMQAKPDLIIFSDTGSEKPATYAYLDKMNTYLQANDFPTITVVGKNRRKGLIDSSLHESCLRLRTMPSLAYGGKSCSLKWKAAEMDYFLGRWIPAQQARMLGLPVLKLIGYDASPADLRRYKLKGDAKTQFAYPLRDAGLTRPDLMMIIESAGLEQPGKSACFFCPASQPQEVRDLAILHPELAAIALKIEAQAILRSTIEGKIKSTIGLGRRWTWRDTINSEQLEYLDTHFDTGLAARCELTARATKAS